MTGTSELVRSWRGRSPEERVAERRARLLDAALEVFSKPGYQAAKVRDVCRAAGLTERYFYESFANKEQALVALGSQIVGDFVAAAFPHIDRARSDLHAGASGAMTAVVHSLTDDPRRARILFVESVGVSPWIEDQRRAAIGVVTRVIVDAAVGQFGDWAAESIEAELIARSVVGAASELVVAYARGELPIDQRELAASLTQILERASSVLVAMAAERHGPPAPQPPQTTRSSVTPGSQNTPPAEEQ